MTDRPATSARAGDEGDVTMWANSGPTPDQATYIETVYVRDPSWVPTDTHTAAYAAAVMDVLVQADVAGTPPPPGPLAPCPHCMESPA